jgi:plastocyanin
MPCLSVRFALLLALPLASAAAAAGAAAPASVVQGVVRITGATTSAWAVVSLQAARMKLVPPGEPVKIDQRGFRFVPHVVAIQTGTTIRFVNNDPEPHNVYSPEGRYNLGVWPTGETKDFVFKKAGVYSQLCNIHPDMQAFVVVLDTPYYAVTDETGRFAIPDVPAGKYRLEVWHEAKDGLAREVVVGPGTPRKLDLVVDR